MSSPPPDFRPALATLSAERFAGFVADLWAAHGRLVQRDGRRLTASDEAAGESALWVVAPGEDARVPDDADVVVHAQPTRPPGVPADASVVGPQGLYRRLRYAIDRTDADRLTDAYLEGCCLQASSPSIGPRTTTPGEADDPADGGSNHDAEVSDATETAIPAITDSVETPAPAGGRSTRRGLLLGAGTFVAGLATATVVGRIDPFDDRSAGAQPSTDQPSDDDSLTRPAAIPVPGLSRDGVTGPRTLSVGHVDQLRDRSFTIGSTKTVHAADGRLLSSLSLKVHIASSRGFRVSIVTDGPAGQPLFGEPTASVELWSDRETYLRRVEAGGETRHEVFGAGATVSDWYYWSNVVPFDGPPYATLEFYRDLFELVPVAVTGQGGDEEAPYVLTAVDHRIDEAPMLFDMLDLDSTIRDLEAVGLVSAEGLIPSLRLSYEGLRREAPATVQWSIGYRNLGATSVERPAWADQALAD